MYIDNQSKDPPTTLVLGEGDSFIHPLLVYFFFLSLDAGTFSSSSIPANNSVRSIFRKYGANAPTKPVNSPPTESIFSIPCSDILQRWSVILKGKIHNNDESSQGFKYKYN